MADVPTNTIPRRFFTNGGELEIDDGTNAYQVSNVLSLTLTDALRQIIEYTDQGAAQQGLRGDTGYSTIAFTARGGHSGTPANDIQQVLATDGTTHLAKQFTVRIKVPDSPGSATGMLYTWNNCHVRPEATRLSGTVNNEHDEISYTLASPDSKPTAATY